MVLIKSLPEEIQSNITTNADSSGYHAINAVATRLLKEKYQGLLHDLTLILLNLYDTRSYKMLAQELIPEEYAINSAVAIKIIHLGVQAAAQAYNSDSLIQNQPINLGARASRVKTSANLLRGSGHRMLESIGRQPFSYEEICYIVNLMTNVVFQWEHGSNIGKPNWNKIAIELNRLYGTNRSAKSVSDQIKTMKYAEDPRLLNAYNDLDTAMEDGTYYMDVFIQGVIIEKELYERFAPNIAAILNDLNDLRSYWEIVRDLMPEEFTFGEDAANQIISIIIDYIKFDESIEFSADLFEKRKICINVNRKRKIGLANQMLENQGAIRFCREEFTRFMELRRTHIRFDGPQAGRTNYDIVAATLNIEFHSGENLRTAEKLSSLVRTYRQNAKKKSYMYPSMDDLQIPIIDIVQAYFPLEFQEQ